MRHKKNTDMDYKILPLVGFDKVKFGQTKDKVLEILGTPDEIEEDQQYGDTPNEKTTVFYYDELGLSFSFEKEEGYRLMEISFDGTDFVLCGNIRTGMSFDEVMKAVKASDLGEGEEEDVSEFVDSGDDIKVWVFEDTNVDLYFENDILSTIQLGPEFTEDGNSIVWPK